MSLLRGSLLVAGACLLLTITASGREPAGKPDPKTEALPKLSSRLGDVRLKHGNMVIAVAFSPNGKTLACGGWDKLIRSWDSATGKEGRRFEGHGGAIFGIAFSPDGHQLVSCGDDQTIRLWEVATGRQRLRLDGHKGGVTKVVFAPDGKTIASGSYDRTIRIWDAETGKELRQIGGKQQGFTTIAFSPDGRYLASGSEENAACLWEVSSGREFRRLIGHTNQVVGLTFSPDGRLLATASEDQTIRLWEVRTGKEVRQLRGHNNGTWAVAFSPDGRLLATGARDHIIRLWDVVSGTALRQANGHEQGVPTLTFSADGRSLASGSHDSTAAIWDVAVVAPASVPEANLSVADLWTELTADAARSQKAVWQMIATPGQSVPFLQGQLRPMPGVEAARLTRLITDLDSIHFSVRQQASDELEKLGELALSALQEVLKKKPSLEVQTRVERLLARQSGPVASPELLQALRAIEVLEKTGTPEARRHLETLAKGAAGAQLTEEARAALSRMRR